MFKTTQAINDDMDDIFPTRMLCPNCGAELIGQFFIRHHIKDCYGAHEQEEDETHEDKKESVKKLTDILEEKNI